MSRRHGKKCDEEWSKAKLMKMKGRTLLFHEKIRLLNFDSDQRTEKWIFYRWMGKGRRLSAYQTSADIPFQNKILKK